jgi:hypothetical protein
MTKPARKFRNIAGNSIFCNERESLNPFKLLEAGDQTTGAITRAPPGDRKAAQSLC